MPIDLAEVSLPQTMSWIHCNITFPGHWRQFLDTPSYQKLFGTSEEVIWKYVLPVTVEGVVTRELTRSYISALPEGEREIVTNNVRSVLEAEQKIWVNEEEGIFEYPYRTTVISKRARVLFTYYAYLILFVRIPCHLDTQIYVSFGPGL